MIYKKYGTTLQSVETDFDARAMNEIGFRRDRKEAIPVEEFETGWEKVDERELKATSEGPVQHEAEVQVLDKLLAALREYESALEDNEILVVESEAGVDYPKLREARDDVIRQGQNRHYFRWSVDPGLRIGRYRKRV